MSLNIAKIMNILKKYETIYPCI